MKSDVQQLIRTTELCEPAGVMPDMDRSGQGEGWFPYGSLLAGL